MMSDNNLTDLDKTRLISAMDHKQATDYDETLYNLLSQTSPPLPHEIDDGSRRAISKYVIETWPIQKVRGVIYGDSIDATAMGAMTETLMIGYELGRTLQKSLLRGVDKT